jgi:hypothetical protein
MSENRKSFLKKIAGSILFSSTAGLSFAKNINEMIVDVSDFDGEGAPDDEHYWKKIAKKYYEVSHDYINLENGYYGIQPKPVLAAFQKNIHLANEQAAKFARREYPALAISVKKDLAAFLEVNDEEIIITRNATEALNIAIQGYPFKQGDEVLINQLDYFSMIETFRMLEKREKIKVKAFEMPLLPRNEDDIVELYRSRYKSHSAYTCIQYKRIDHSCCQDLIYGQRERN